MSFCTPSKYSRLVIMMPRLWGIRNTPCFLRVSPRNNPPHSDPPNSSKSIITIILSTLLACSCLSVPVLPYYPTTSHYLALPHTTSHYLITSLPSARASLITPLNDNPYNSSDYGLVILEESSALHRWQGDGTTRPSPHLLPVQQHRRP